VSGCIENIGRIGVALKEHIQEGYRQLGPNVARWSKAVLYAILIASVPVVLGILAWPVLIVWFAAPIARLLQFPLWQAFALVLVAALGFVLYFVRENFKQLYGLAEIAIGLSAAWTGFPKLAAEPLPGALALAAGVYIIVRGIDNYVVGRTPGGKFAERVKRIIKRIVDELDKEHDEEA
jgi:hypothetical protein